jgi:hypothetical protein
MIHPLHRWSIITGYILVTWMFIIGFYGRYTFIVHLNWNVSIYLAMGMFIMRFWGVQFHESYLNITQHIYNWSIFTIGHLLMYILLIIHFPFPNRTLTYMLVLSHVFFYLLFTWHCFIGMAYDITHWIYPVTEQQNYHHILFNESDEYIHVSTLDTDAM